MKIKHWQGYGTVTAKKISLEKHFDYENPKRAGKKTYIKAINENE